MKKFLLLLVCAGFIGAANAQTGTTTTADLKEHVCSATCTKEAHVLLHGEKGHTCTEACTALTTEKKAAGCCAGKKEGATCAKGAKAEAQAEAHAAKEHACTAACTEGKHTYACGEKGHECGTACAHAH
jgi:hypothetical protein